ncbi:MAG: hypothetical protein GX093_14060 [Xanthomonadaceae bacterium]|nr:hypothetical protein [Xanthomonadaceae bacterium]
MSNLTPAPAPRWRVIVDALPLTIVLCLVLYWAATALPPPSPQAPLKPVTAASSQALLALFAQHDYAWPPQGPVPRLAVQALPPDLAELPVSTRKALFFSILTPLILAENERLQQERSQLQKLLARSDWTEAERNELAALAKRYAVRGELSDPETQRQLLLRVDEIPLGLALAQAAKESGWGTSRFAREARNLFGVWTWDRSQGIVPAARPSGATHLVRVFPDLQASVRNYMHTLNTGAAYSTLRLRRAYLRSIGAPLQPLALADGLERYSERGQIYVKEVRALILGNHLDQLDGVTLAPQGTTSRGRQG